MVLGVGWKDKFVKYSLITKIVGIKEIKYKNRIVFNSGINNCLYILFCYNIYHIKKSILSLIYIIVKLIYQFYHIIYNFL
jgi:hypothetical protein